MMDKLCIDTKTGKLSLNDKELKNVREIGIRVHDDDRITVSVTLSPCEVNAHIGVADGRLGWLDRV